MCDIHWLISRGKKVKNGCLGKLEHLQACISSLGPPYKLPQTLWLKTTDIYWLTVLGARSPASASRSQNQGFHRAMLPPGSLGEKAVLAPAASADSRLESGGTG